MEMDDMQRNTNSDCDGMQPTIICRTSESSWLQCALALWMVAGSIHLNMLLIILALILLPSVWAFLVLGFLLTLVLIPVEENSEWGQRLAKFVCYHGSRYFPITVIIENMKAFNPSNAYVFAFEPHSVIPVGLLALCNHSGFMPLPNIKALASSAVFYTPILRHLWSWLGVVPASRENFVKLLNAGYSCVVIPGGVQEILYMEHGHEVAFLKRRRGFIHVSIETGCPLVPVFCFGQTDLYHWWKPRGKLFNVLCRVIKFTPLLFWGTFGQDEAQGSEVMLSKQQRKRVQRQLARDSKQQQGRGVKGCPNSSKSGTAARRDRAVQTAARKVQGCVPKAVQTAAKEGEKTAANDEAVGTQQATRAVG